MAFQTPFPTRSRNKPALNESKNGESLDAKINQHSDESSAMILDTLIDFELKKLIYSISKNCTFYVYMTSSKFFA